ncbi:CD3072 family TudS-related putative desulfidase [Thermincola potens]|uniref:Uncharacterized protein n=1 Tax=Thermincola potens (strain JR) TaxID=635013 RepID=D5XD79_THEPJ|nr:CD3072 family TudS-related putative desulfidase [Thermincola potens]ADG81727.1 Protein of unknown function DUF2297 [Thermincola potens JR]
MNSIKRNHKVTVLAHCLLNSSVKVVGLANYTGVLEKVLLQCLREKAGIVQLPCPETSYCGLKRWGQTREQYDHRAYRRNCRALLEPVVDLLEELQRNGCSINILGVDGSPSCGVTKTCTGFSGGELDSREKFDEQLANLRKVEGPGVFMEELAYLLSERNIRAEFTAIDENTLDWGNKACND